MADLYARWKERLEIWLSLGGEWSTMSLATLCEDVAREVRLEEREACAEICHNTAEKYWRPGDKPAENTQLGNIAAECRDAIRGRTCRGVGIDDD